MIKNIYRLLLSGRVRRWHTHPHMRDCGEQNAEHQWTTAMIALAIEPDLSRAALIEALTHDVGELDTVDASYLFKRDNPNLTKSLRACESDAREKLIDNDAWEESHLYAAAIEGRENTILKAADWLAGYGAMIQHQPWLRFEDDWVQGLGDTYNMLRVLSSDHKQYHRICKLIDSWHKEADKRDRRSS